MKYYIIAGEASGDLHGANLVRQLNALDSRATIRAWGGDQMEAVGATIVKHYKDLAFMGFLEVAMNLPTILRNFKFCKNDIAKFDPDVIIFIDYPGFNLRMAKWASKKGFRTFYYISPQVWAWKSSRVFNIKKYVDEMFVILPFEESFYQDYDYPVHFVGHPLLDVVEKFETPDKLVEKIHPEGLPVIALLPGSRRQEIENILPVMLKAIRPYDGYQIVLAAAPSIPADFYKQILSKQGDNSQVRIIEGKTYAVLSEATLALVTSGTATLETALFNVPEIVLYKGSWISYQLARRLVKVDYISLVNLIAGKEVVPELIQRQMTPENVQKHVNRLLEGPERAAMLKDYEIIRNRLGGPGASKRCARIIWEKLQIS